MLAKFLPILALACSIAAQSPMIYDNGPFVTHPAGGAGGADASVLQNVAPVSHTTYGVGAQNALGYAVADNFVVNGTWVIDRIRVYTYQTGSTTTSTITGVGCEIIENGVPGVGTTVLNSPVLTTTNVPAATGWTNCYRTLVADQATAVNRPIMYADVTINPPIVLTAGVYWMMWNMAGSLASGPWAPPVSVTNQGITGDAQQQLGAAAAWNPIVDVADGQALPFTFFGASSSPNGSITNLGGGCGSATMTVQGQPAMGGFVRAELNGTTQPLTAIGLGFSDPNAALPCACVQHSSFDAIIMLVQNSTFTPPLNAAYVGLNLFIQGVEGGAGPCSFGLSFQTTDGFQVQFY
jgi:hypothetical protein